MDVTDMLNSVTSSPGGLLGGIFTFLGAAVVVYRKYIRSDKVDSAEAGAKVDQIERLQKLLESADARADAANARTDKAFDERNALFQKIGAMASEMEGMRSEIKRLTDEIDQLRKQINANDHTT